MSPEHFVEFVYFADGSDCLSPIWLVPLKKRFIVQEFEFPVGRTFTFYVRHEERRNYDGVIKRCEQSLAFMTDATDYRIMSTYHDDNCDLSVDRQDGPGSDKPYMRRVEPLVRRRFETPVESGGGFCTPMDDPFDLEPRGSFLMAPVRIEVGEPRDSWRNAR